MAQKKQPDLAHRIAQALRAAQYRRGLTQKQAADELGVHVRTYEAWVREVSTPWPQHRVHIARVWEEITPEELGLEPELVAFVAGGIQNGGVSKDDLLSTAKMMKALALALLDEGLSPETRREILAVIDEAGLPAEDVARAGLEAARATAPQQAGEVRPLRRKRS